MGGVYQMVKKDFAIKHLRFHADVNEAHHRIVLIVLVYVNFHSVYLQRL